MFSFFQLWSKLLWVAEENQGFTAYREFLINELLSRARKVRWKRFLKLLAKKWQHI